MEPRKSPVQARSTASVEAILQATIQVLLHSGKERLTTTLVARRAGVSVGTLYQYFPNKSALLQAVMKRHLNAVIEAVERVCEEQRGAPMRTMATALIQTFLDAKLRDPKTSVALYALSSDLDGVKIVKQIGLRFNRAIAAMLATSPEPMRIDPDIAATVLRGAMAGISRQLLESGCLDRQLPAIRRELISLACAYLDACTGGAIQEETRSCPLGTNPLELVIR